MAILRLYILHLHGFQDVKPLVLMMLVAHWSCTPYRPCLVLYMAGFVYSGRMNRRDRHRESLHCKVCPVTR